MHIGIGTAILILGLIYFAINYPGFRYLLFWTIGVCVGIIGFLILYYR